MARPFPKKISQIKPTLTNVVTTSHFAVTFGGLSSELITYLKRKGIDSRYTQDQLSLLCCRASLPGSSHATADVIGNYTGVAEKFAHTRTFVQMSMDFYVDDAYKSMKFLEHWMEFMSNGSTVGDGSDPLRSGYYYRMRYPNQYKCDETRIVKFERDYKNFLEYKFIGMFPLSLDATTVSYEGSRLLKATATFNYDRHIAGKSRSIDRYDDESENDDPTTVATQKSFAETLAAKNLSGSNDINGFGQRLFDRNLDGYQRLFADGRFLNGGSGGSTIISEGISAATGGGGSRVTW